ncbi:hypothetical protein NEHOM01_0981 [Nematocida homosporus]|uniref:uncharacterized protein n=1 Tax=Nematocida homosporus TaxID=1912981 RepID=UPI002220FC0A|nr:uncharacterized protein NEHOM01_0981 [Nematocida homosporus]KAI5185655.1 hypothetical protein NEHOM01_0981 [Nematocida homosporus]
MPELSEAQQLKSVVESSPENKRCVDCNMARPQWASITYGIFVCLNCAGVHRSFGVKVSVVKSVGMDLWKPEEVSAMDLGGNKRFLSYLAQYNLEQIPKQELYHHTRIQEYAQTLYQQLLKKHPNLTQPFHSPDLSHTPSSPTLSKVPSPAAIQTSHSSTPKSRSSNSHSSKSYSSKPLSNEYTSRYSETSSSPLNLLGNLEGIQDNLSGMLSRAAGYVYTGARTLSSQISEKVIVPASAALREKSSQFSEYMKKPKEPESIESTTNRHQQSKPRSKPTPETPKRKPVSDKWD